MQAEALHAAVLEFKRELPSKDKKVMKTVVAFANCRDEALLAFLKAHPGAPLREAADAFFVNVSTISRFVQDMRNEGRL